jgi:hypothetical protein|tara:strand:- start:326 stop:700 length:375 start_codon:yes stop_codon:yes gene_type:complete
MKTVISETYKKYGYKMFDCSQEFFRQYREDCYAKKKSHNPSEKFNYVTFVDVETAVKKINSVFIPAECGILPEVQWCLQESSQLLIKEIWFYNYEEQQLYQCAVERAWALGGHLDIRTEQYYYD